MKTDATKHDAALNAVLHGWQGPAPSPWLKTRVTQRLVEDARARVTWPFSLPKLVGMATAAVLLGGIVGVNIPSVNTLSGDSDAAALEMSREAEVADTVDVSAVIAADTETLEGLW